MKGSKRECFETLPRLPRSQFPTGNAYFGAAVSLTRGRAAIDLHFQPEAGNEVLWEF
ncbi:hypothetical protein [Nostoc sp.]|uniref:hypothetical protein n=1 Tax=Nostoc sp. TaxID=1180 RepID=UPI002FF80F37